MDTQVDIINAALGEIGSTALITTIDDNTEEARAAKAVYERCLKRALEVGRPKFAHRTAILDIPNIAVTRTGWDYIFELPPDFLSMDPEVTFEYDIQGEFLDEANVQILLTNLAEVEIQYVAYIDTPAVYSAEFAEALVLLLASKFAAALPKDRAMAKDLEAQFRAVIAEAGAAQRNQRNVSNLEQRTPSLRARGYLDGSDSTE